ncbi:MAG: rhomboid family intramembrane serine protease [bacterium]|nr:rhomboid family intramembrane serine protease [bacterium]
MSYEFQPKQEDEPQPEISVEDYLAAQKKSIRKKAWWAIGIGGFVVAVHVGWLLLFAIIGADPDFSVLFRSIFFILGLFGFAAGLYGLYYARSLKLEDLTPTPEAIEFAQRSAAVTPYYTMILLGSIIAVFVAQGSVGFDVSLLAAGFVRSSIVENGEYWRLLTAGALHINLLHIFLNGNALYGLGGLVEYLSNRAHLAIVFVLSIIGGCTASLLLSPIEQAAGASGGIMGIFGYLLIYAYRRKQQLPPGFLKSLLINVAFIAGFGVIAYQIVDNFAHAGGFLVGAVYAFFQVPKDLAADPRKTNSIVNTLGIIAIAIYIAEALFAIFRITGRA